MYACISEIGGGFLKGRAADYCPRISTDPRRPTIHESTSASLSITEQATRVRTGQVQYVLSPVRRQSSMPEFLPTFTCRYALCTPNYYSARACLSLHRLQLVQFVGPEQLQASVLKPHVQCRKVRMAPPLLDDPGHANELRLPVPFLHPYLHAWTHFVPSHESSPSRSFPLSALHTTVMCIITLHHLV
jgi:hypothetical protein